MFSVPQRLSRQLDINFSNKTDAHIYLFIRFVINGIGLLQKEMCGNANMHISPYAKDCLHQYTERKTEFYYH